AGFAHFIAADSSLWTVHFSQAFYNSFKRTNLSEATLDVHRGFSAEPSCLVRVVASQSRIVVDEARSLHPCLGAAGRPDVAGHGRRSVRAGRPAVDVEDRPGAVERGDGTASFG